MRTVKERIARAEESNSLVRSLSATTPARARSLILKGWMEEDSATVEERRTALSQLVERIEFDPETRRARAHYRLPMSRQRAGSFDLDAAARELGLKTQEG